jgi:hypothetical protein
MMVKADEVQNGSGMLWVVPLLDALLALILILLLLVHPPTQAQESSSPGMVLVEARWPDACDSDVDLWVRAPGDRSVGYSAQSGRVFNLLRDDRGTTDDLSNLNFESAYSRGAPAGEYAVTIHLYDHRGRCPLPLPVDVQVSIKPDGSSPRVLMRNRVLLSRIGQETTAARFTLNEENDINGPVSTLPIKLRENR